MRMHTVRARLTAASLTLLTVSASTAAVAHECTNTAMPGSSYSGGAQNFRWKDPLTGGCQYQGFTNPPELRRGGTIRLTVVRHGIDFTDRARLVSENTGVTYYASGNVWGTGYITIDLALAGASLGHKTIKFPHATGGFPTIVEVVRRGEITGITQIPNPGIWGQEVQATVSGNDIGNADMWLPRHSDTITSNSSSQLRFSAKATGTTFSPSVMVSLHDKSLVGSPTKYNNPNKPTVIVYTPCAAVLGIGAPQLSTPTAGSVMSFPSATDPLKAAVTFSWPHAGDPQGRYILHVERSMLSGTTTVTTTSGGKTGGSVTLAPLVSDEMVGPFVSSTAIPIVVRQMTRHALYKWKVRAVNCGQSAPWSTVSTLTIK